MKAVLCACGSAACALACMAVSVIGIVRLFLDWRSGLWLLAAGLVLAVAAKMLDRRKMWALYGREEGDRLHRDSGSGESPAALAWRDLATYAERRQPEPTEEVVQGAPD